MTTWVVMLEYSKFDVQKGFSSDLVKIRAYLGIFYHIQVCSCFSAPFKIYSRKRRMGSNDTIEDIRVFSDPFGRVWAQLDTSVILE